MRRKERRDVAIVQMRFNLLFIIIAILCLLSINVQGAEPDTQVKDGKAFIELYNNTNVDRLQTEDQRKLNIVSAKRVSLKEYVGTVSTFEILDRKCHRVDAENLSPDEEYYVKMKVNGNPISLVRPASWPTVDVKNRPCPPAFRDAFYTEGISFETLRAPEKGFRNSEEETCFKDKNGENFERLRITAKPGKRVAFGLKYKGHIDGGTYMQDIYALVEYSGVLDTSIAIRPPELGADFNKLIGEASTKNSAGKEIPPTYKIFQPSNMELSSISFGEQVIDIQSLPNCQGFPKTVQSCKVDLDPKLNGKIFGEKSYITLINNGQQDSGYFRIDAEVHARPHMESLTDADGVKKTWVVYPKEYKKDGKIEAKDFGRNGGYRVNIALSVKNKYNDQPAIAHLKLVDSTGLYLTEFDNKGKGDANNKGDYYLRGDGDLARHVLLERGEASATVELEAELGCQKIGGVTAASGINTLTKFSLQTALKEKINAIGSSAVAIALSWEFATDPAKVRGMLDWISSTKENLDDYAPRGYIMLDSVNPRTQKLERHEFGLLNGRFQSTGNAIIYNNFYIDNKGNKVWTNGAHYYNGPDSLEKGVSEFRKRDIDVYGGTFFQ